MCCVGRVSDNADGFLLNEFNLVKGFAEICYLE